MFSFLFDTKHGSGCKYQKCDLLEGQLFTDGIKDKGCQEPSSNTTVTTSVVEELRFISTIQNSVPDSSTDSRLLEPEKQTWLPYCGPGYQKLTQQWKGDQTSNSCGMCVSLQSVYLHSSHIGLQIVSPRGFVTQNQCNSPMPWTDVPQTLSYQDNYSSDMIQDQANHSFYPRCRVPSTGRMAQVSLARTF